MAFSFWSVLFRFLFRASHVRLLPLASSRQTHRQQTATHKHTITFFRSSTRKQTHFFWLLKTLSNKCTSFPLLKRSAWMGTPDIAMQKLGGGRATVAGRPSRQKRRHRHQKGSKGTGSAINGSRKARSRTHEAIHLPSVCTHEEEAERTPTHTHEQNRRPKTCESASQQTATEEEKHCATARCEHTSAHATTDKGALNRLSLHLSNFDVTDLSDLSIVDGDMTPRTLLQKWNQDDINECIVADGLLCVDDAALA
jgi:hypothetical protein